MCVDMHQTTYIYIYRYSSYRSVRLHKCNCNSQTNRITLNCCFFWNGWVWCLKWKRKEKQFDISNPFFFFSPWTIRINPQAETTLPMESEGQSATAPFTWVAVTSDLTPKGPKTGWTDRKGEETGNKTSQNGEQTITGGQRSENPKVVPAH